MVQEQFVGFDVSQSETAICVVDGVGKVVWQGKCASTPEAMAVAVRRRAPHATRIRLETGPMSSWHYRNLTAPVCRWSALMPAMPKQRWQCS